MVTLSAPSNLTGPPDDSLRPEDKRLENLLVKTHQATAWSVKLAMVTSLFNRASILWLRQLQERLPILDIWSQQDINKVVAALEYSADATLNTSCFAAKAISSTVAACRLLWLRQWQADASPSGVWPSPPSKALNCLGQCWNPLLVESRDKHCILPNMSRRSE